MQNWNGNGNAYGNAGQGMMGHGSMSRNQPQSRTVSNIATGQATQVMQPQAQKKRVKVGAGWNGQYGPQVSLDIAALHAISRFLQEQGVETGSLRLKFYANSNKLNPKAPDFTFVASDIFGVYIPGQGYQDLEVRPQAQSSGGNTQP